MRSILLRLCLLASVVGAGAAGYWYGRHQPRAPMPIEAAVAQSNTGRKILYYRNPMGQPDFSPEPKKDSMGMAYIPVYEGEEDGSTAASGRAGGVAKPQAEGAKGRVLYYRNPMGLPDTSPMPKKDSMGMEYIPVYESEQDDSGIVKVSVAKIQRLGVRTEPAAMRELKRAIRAVGTVQVDERRLVIVSSRFEGWIEKLYVNTTGQTVQRGEALMEVYSPELLAVQQEYLLATRIRADLAEAALERLRTWNIPEDQIQRLRRERKPARNVTLRAPSDGVVLEKSAITGMRFMPGDLLFRIADLSSVWLLADVFEQDLAQIREGQPTIVRVDAYPDRIFEGRVGFIYPTVTRETRTAKVRIEIPNLDRALKSDMYARVEIAAPTGVGFRLAVPESAVLDNGTRQAVLIDRGEGRFEPREIKLGGKADGYYEVLSGLEPDEKVVVTANFLIDAESNLRAALRAFTAPAGQEQPK